ncbi:MAG: hypothetical protein A2293_04060 [Elusimicrobia bacterium RIFOXYB2_FULL_49_7]|nr:MAG: hypothetical protein A2293_04060 [Elusimicrobia bacterium RIFOXYB2_FULL_49_7]
MVRLFLALIPFLLGTPLPASAKPMPEFLELGSKTCIPCRLMAPIVERLKVDFKNDFTTRFVEVGIGGDKTLAEKFDIKVIPTQIFLDENDKELWRHEGYISRFGILDKWRELKYAFADSVLKTDYSRMEPAGKDERLKSQICAMCDGTIDDKTLVVVKTAKGDVRYCGPHCYFIMESCLLEDKSLLEDNTQAADYQTGRTFPAAQLHYLYGFSDGNARPSIKAFKDGKQALKETGKAGGSILDWATLKRKEQAIRCGFCDRAVYPEDAAVVKADGIYTWGCCSHCALGVAARTGKDIEVFQPDRLTGVMVTVKTFNGYVQSIEPATSVAWFGLKKGPDGKFGSAGCFHQGFFTTPENLKTWVLKNPTAVGGMITIDQALADKMKLNPSQIAKACKIGECAPK